MIVYNNILQRMADNGWSSYRLKKENVLPGSVIDRLRENRPVTTETLNVVCRLCKCQPGDLLIYQPDGSGTE